MRYCRILPAALLFATGARGDVAVSLETMDERQVQELLESWNLAALRPGFERMGIDGELLSLYQPGDLLAHDVPEASALHLRLLHKKLSEVQSQQVIEVDARGRRLGVTSDASGVSILRNNSAVLMGEQSDTGFKRDGDAKLRVVGNLFVGSDEFLSAEDEDLLEAVGGELNVVQALAQLAGELRDLKETVSSIDTPDNMCLPSCKHFIDRFPGAESGEYCVVVDVLTNATTTLYCDMDFLGGGWTYVARGSDSNDGCQTDSYGTAIADPTTNSRWSLGQSQINNVGSHGFDYIEYYVTIGYDNSNDYTAHEEYRIFRAPAHTGINFQEPMDSTYNVQVWAGEYWITGEFNCNTGDCGPCWEPGRQNLCCDEDGSDCSLASQDKEGQWSHSNTNQHLRCSVADYDQDQLVLYVRGSNVEGQECYSSCFQAKQHRPDAPSGVYCIIIGGSDDHREDLYCDMETQGGGWTFVARGTNSNDGCDTDSFGTVSADHYLDNRWSLGDWAINEIGYDQGNQWLEYFVTVGHNNDEGYAPHEYARVARVPLGTNFTLGSPMDQSFSVEVWNGAGWVAMEKDCAATDCGPCWEPDYQNWCCEMEQSGLLLDCPEAGMDQEGQWSNANTNQHLRCFDGDYDQDGLVLFVR